METKNHLKAFFTEHWKYMAVSAACKLNIFDNLLKPKTVTKLSEELSLNPDKLLILLNALYQNGFLDKELEFFKVNSLSEYLTESTPESLKYACLNWSAEHMNAWQDLDYSIKTGKSSFEKLYGLAFFDYLNENPEKLDAYHKAMYEYAKDDYKTLLDLIDFSRFRSVMDVGGSYGAVLENIKKKNPEVECILFDLEQVVNNVKLNDIQTIGGSFFDNLPEVAELIILSRILHDWNDDKSAIILQNCFEALPIDGALLIIENCSDKIKSDLSLLSLNMAAICESYERSSKEYIGLAEKSNFRFQESVRLNDLQTILIFKK
jgi:C-methyltransferase